MIDRLLIVILLIVTSCQGRQSKRLPVLKLSGINGKALYYWHEERKEVVMVMKEEYNNQDSIRLIVMVNKDTLKVGDEFSGNFDLHEDKYSIDLEFPETKTIYQSDSNYIFHETYKLRTLQPGLFKFKGNVVYPNDTIPFEYTILVVDK